MRLHLRSNILPVHVGSSGFAVFERVIPNRLKKRRAADSRMRLALAAKELAVPMMSSRPEMIREIVARLGAEEKRNLCYAHLSMPDCIDELSFARRWSISKKSICFCRIVRDGTIVTMPQEVG